MSVASVVSHDEFCRCLDGVSTARVSTLYSLDVRRRQIVRVVRIRESSRATAWKVVKSLCEHLGVFFWWTVLNSLHSRDLRTFELTLNESNNLFIQAAATIRKK
jgi:hypothetical protein